MKSSDGHITLDFLYWDYFYLSYSSPRTLFFPQYVSLTLCRGSRSCPGSWKRERKRCQEKKAVWTKLWWQKPAKRACETGKRALDSSGRYALGSMEKRDGCVRSQDRNGTTVRQKRRNRGRFLNGEMTWGKKANKDKSGSRSLKTQYLSISLGN